MCMSEALFRDYALLVNTGALACRRSGLIPHNASSTAKSSQMLLSPELTTYLLCVVGHILEDEAQSLAEAEHVATATKAVAVYKLLTQV